MDFDYTCGHKFQSHPGATAPTDCPACNQGNLIGVKAKFYMSDELRQRLHDALASIKPLTEKRYRMRVECPDHGTTVGQTFCGGCRDVERKAELERQEVIETAKNLTRATVNATDLSPSTDKVFGALYDAGMLRKVGDQ